MGQPRRPFQSSRVSAVAAVLGLLALLLLPVCLHARAGGGEGFSGGGGGGGGFGGGGGGFGGHGFGGGGYYGGGGGGGIDGFGLFVIIVIVIVVLAFRYWQSQQQGVSGSSDFSRGSGLPNRFQQQSMLAELKQRDPPFDESAFLNRVKTAFVGLQDSWCAQELTRVRPFISDGVHERFSLQFNEQKAAGYRDRMDGLEVIGLQIARVTTDVSFDAVTVRITARADDYPVSIADGKRMPGPSSFLPFTEYWTFLRRRGAQTTPDKPGLLEGHCPNCGAPVEMNQSANCTHCKALLRSGQYDWVLSEITQDSVWTPSAIGGVGETFTAFRQRDPGFNTAALEDRASVIFWRRAAAWRQGKIAPLQKAALPAFIADFAQSLKPQTPGGARQFFGQCAVGSVDALGIIPASPSQPGAGDRAIVRVVWSAQRWISRPNGAQSPASADYLPFKTLMVLTRKSGVQTDAGQAVSSSHCPTCGAPETDSATNGCEFCGTVLNDGSVSWVLSATLAQASGAGQSVLQQLADQATASIPM